MIIILKRFLGSMFNSCCKDSWYVSSRGHECGEPNSCLIAMCPPLPVWWFPQDTIRPPSYTQEIRLIASTIFENDWLRTIKWNWQKYFNVFFGRKTCEVPASIVERWGKRAMKIYSTWSKQSFLLPNFFILENLLNSIKIVTVLFCSKHSTIWLELELSVILEKNF